MKVHVLAGGKITSYISGSYDTTWFSPTPNILNLSRLKQFADANLNLACRVGFVF